MEKLKISVITFFMIFSCMLSTYAETPWSEEKEGTTTLHFYVQHVATGPSTSEYTVASAEITDSSPTSFGQVNVFDDKLTAVPEHGSDEVGRLQGLAASADMRARAISATLNFFITAGKYSGSTITVVGRNPIGEKQRELPVVGGTGAFRFARGYVLTSTYPNEDAANRMVLEYEIHVITPSV